MRIVGKILLGFLVLLIVVLAGVLGWLYVTDLAKYQTQLETLITKQTGREFAIGGNFQLKLLPAPHLLAEDISVANAQWGSEPTMAEIGLLAADIDLKSLVFGPIMVREFRLADVNILLETNDEGAANTDMGGPSSDDKESAKKSGDGSLPLMVEHAELSNLTVVQRTAGAADQVTRIESLTIAANENNQLALNGSGEILQRPLAIEALLEPNDQVQALGAITYTINGSWGLLGLDIEGQAANLRKLDGIELQAVLSADDIAEIVTVLELPLTLAGPLDAKVKVDYSKPSATSAISVQANAGPIAATLQAKLLGDELQLDATLADLAALGNALEIADLPQKPLQLSGALSINEDEIVLEEVTASLEDTVADISGQISLADKSADLTVDISGPSLADLTPLLPAIPFQASAQTLLAPNHLILEDFTLTVDESDLDGRIELDTRERTLIAVDLQSGLLDLSPFTTQDETQPDLSSDTDQAAPAAPAEAEQPPSRYVFVDEPLPFAAIKNTDADIKLVIDSLRNHASELRNVTVDGQWHDRDLNLALALDGTYGGKAVGDLKLNTSGDDATLAILVRAKDMRLAKDTENDDIKIPVTDVTIDIESVGNTPRALAASSDGRVLLTQGPGQVENAMLSKISGDLLAQLFSALNPFAKDEKYTRWDCTVLSMDIVDGESIINGMLLQGEKIMVVGGGDIDLNTEELKVEFNTKPRKGIGITADMFVTPFVQLGGTLAEPGIELNTKGAILTTGAAVATLGISLLVTGVAERATAEGDKCEQTLEELPAHAPLR
jgi:uncharacterized protein involved in outer membrane biogenesis